MDLSNISESVDDEEVSIAAPLSVDPLVYIYALCEPDSGEFRYVGKTLTPRTRLNAHVSEAISSKWRSHKNHWIQSLDAQCGCQVTALRPT
jgi:hypothetical protein